jgi:GTP-binding protein Era
MSNTANLETKAGFVAVVGRPNAGKSTLMNWLLGEKIAIVSHKANATRKRVNAIVMHENSQIILVDTPGLHEKEKLLNQFMLDEALKAIGDCELILFVTPVNDETKYYTEFLEKTDKPHLIIMTKTDQYSNDTVLNAINEFAKYQDKFLELVPISAPKDQNKNELLDTVSKYLGVSPFLYDPEDLTTEHVKDIYREFIREAIFDETSDELPYESDVIIEKIFEKNHKNKLEKIKATIVVEKHTQKGMIIGKGGATIKRIGKSAREKIEFLTQEKVYLELFVSVKKGWSKNKKSLEELGYIF